MFKYRKLLVLLAALSLASILGSATAFAGGHPLSAVLSGANEVTPGDPDGSGVMNLTLNSGQEQICYQLTVENISAPTRSHIHRGVAGVNGPIVVFFFDTVIPDPIPVPDDLQECVNVPRELVKEIRKDPSSFYVNVHNADFPGGAVRGQLSQ